MKRLFILISCFCFLSVSADENIDSLIASWNKISAEFLEVREMDSACKYGNCAVDMLEQKIENDYRNQSNVELHNLKKQKAEALSNLVTAYGTSDQLDLAMECYQEALELYREIGAGDEIFQLYFRMGRVMDLRSNYREAIPYYQMARDQAVKNKSKKDESLAFSFLGLNNRYMGNYSESLRYHLLALRINEELDNKSGIASDYVTVAAILTKLNDYESALDKLNQAKVLFEELSDTSGVAMIFNDLGRIYADLGNTATALDNHLKAASYRQMARDFDGLGASNLYIADIYLIKCEHAKALEYLQEAENAFHISSNKEGIMTVQRHTAEVYMDKNEIENALHWLELAQKTAKEIMNYVGLIKICSLKGEINFDQGKYQLAIQQLNKSLDFAYQMNINQEIYRLNALLAEVYENKGDYKNSVKYLNQSIKYKDSVIANANFAAAVQMEMEYNYQKEKIETELEQNRKDASNQLEITKQETQKKLFLGGVVMFLIISLGLFSRLRYIRKASRDLKEQKDAAEHHRQVAEYESERATQNEKAKELFLANMSHEIRTPMNAIKGMTDIILRNEHPPSQDIYLNAIKQSTDTLLVILNDILDLSKLDANMIEIEKIPFNPLEIIQNIKNLLRFKAEEKGLILNTKQINDIPQFILGDPTRLHQVLVNLANNAIKFTEKGSVTIEVNTIANSANTVTLQFKVIDTGIGIVPEKIDYMFELFTQAHSDTTRLYGGTGLGLSICKRLVNMQNGNINVESEPKVGSTFTVEIPYEITEGVKIKTPEEISVKLSDLDILLVEDNEFNVIVARDELEINIPGVKIDTAENGRIAFEKVQSGHYDLILMDIQMPEMDGYDTTRKIRKLGDNKSKIPIIAMTAYAMKSEIDKCFEAGMNAFVPKPFKREELFRALAEVCQSVMIAKTIKPVDKENNATSHKNQIPLNGKITNMDFLHDFCDGDKDKINKYINMYLKSTPGNLEKIKDAREARDLAALKIIIHSMKPHFNFMGMKETRTRADDIEIIISEEADKGNLEDLIESVVKDCDKSLKELA